jgi:hypothetical protein
MISFEGFGKLVHTDTDFRHFNFRSLEGKYDVSLPMEETFSEPIFGPKKKVFSTVVINTGRTILAELGINHTQSCRNSTLQVQRSMDGDADDHEALNST